MIDMEPDSLHSHRSDYSERRETMRAVFDWAFLIIKLSKGSVERFEKKIFELPNCKNFNIKTSQINFKREKSCGAWVQESCSKNLEQKSLPEREGKNRRKM